MSITEIKQGDNFYRRVCKLTDYVRPNDILIWIRDDSDDAVILAVGMEDMLIKEVEKMGFIVYRERKNR